ncbi:MAG: hypothetical protein KGI67_00015 [Pseudomonadota bacterium]|nr:hypothetical protein [Pseudomonadota bacterium]
MSESIDTQPLRKPIWILGVTALLGVLFAIYCGLALAQASAVSAGLGLAAALINLALLGVLATLPGRPQDRSAAAAESDATLAHAVAEQREALATIAQILKLPPGRFNDFIDQARMLAAENRDLIEAQQHGDAQVQATLLRNMHAVHDQARSHQFGRVTAAAFQAGQGYERLAAAPRAEGAPAQLLTELAAVEDALAHLVGINQETLGRGGRAGEHFTPRGTFVPAEQLAELRELVTVSGSGLAARLHDLVGGLGLIPLERLVGGAADALPAPARELGKPIPQVRVQDVTPGFHSGFADALKRALLQILRNALEHGIETPEQRSAAGKRPQGVIEVSSQRVHDGYEISIRDDGRGLPMHALHRRAVENGVLGPEACSLADEIAERIFRPGISTAAADRGVGLDVVRTLLEEQGASILVLLDKPHVEQAFAPFRLMIRVPAAACAPAA